MSGAVVFLPLSRGMTTIVSFSDFHRVRHTKWHAVKTAKSGRYYAARSVVDDCGHKRMLLLSRELLSASEDKDVDHINGDRLDNRRENLRIASRGENLANRPIGDSWKGRPRSSKYRGVSKLREGVWSAQISISNKKRHLGSFVSETEAATSYDSAAKLIFGEFAVLNFPNPQQNNQPKNT